MATVAKTDNLPNLVVVHPLVLLSAVDHYNRVAKDAAKKRVVGVLLGTVSKGTIDVTNSYAGTSSTAMLVFSFFLLPIFLFIFFALGRCSKCCNRV
jgi:hypothetical protein